jgi:hypothetical protein
MGWLILDAEDVYFMFAIFNIASGIGVLFVQLYFVFFELENIFPRYQIRMALICANLF